MKKILRVLGICLACLLILIAVLGALLGYFVYSPEPAMPPLSGTVVKGALQAGGLTRTFRTYVPKGLAPGAPLLIVMHGSGENGGQIRVETGYAFDRLADQQGFAVVYPDSYSFDWNDCSKTGDFTANGRLVDDVGFVGTLADKLVGELGVDRQRVFATGVSAGGFMALRLALEAPARYRAVAAVAANVPAPDNFKCTPAGPGTSVMLMNGTNDPLVPFDGGEVNLLGLFYKGGNVRSSHDSARYFAAYNKIAAAPASTMVPAAGGTRVEHALWRDGGKVEVELVAIHGGGHGLPQPYYRRARLLGPSPMDPNGAQLIWDFFQRQK